MDNYKVYVTKDFPSIYEERVHFKNDDPNDVTAIIEDEYYVDEPYSEHWVSAKVLKAGEWFWTFKDAKKNWNERRKDLIAQNLKHIEYLQTEVESLKEKTIARSKVEKHKWCNNMPDGKQEQIDRYKIIEHKWERHKLKRKLKEHRTNIIALEEQLKEE